MVKRNDGKKRKPLKRKKINYSKSMDGMRKRRTAEPKRKFNNVSYLDIEYIETE